MEDRKQRRSLYMCHQQESWDCGIACCSAAISHFDCTISYSIVRQQWDALQLAAGGYLSDGPVIPWTMELMALILRILPNNKQQIHFFSTNPTLNNIDALAAIAYYSSSIAEDGVRVRRHLQALRDTGALIHEQPISTQEIVHSLAVGERIFICLVDSITLNFPPPFLKFIRSLSICCCMDNAMDQLMYSGHFIVGVGWKSGNNSIVFFDPATGSLRDADVGVFHRARTAMGTDSDTIAFDLF